MSFQNTLKKVFKRKSGMQEVDIATEKNNCSDKLTLSQAHALRDTKTPGCSGEPWTSIFPRYLHWPWWESKQLVLICRGRGYVGLFAGSPFHFYRVDRETIRRTSQRLWVLSTTAPVSECVGVH